MKRFIGGGVIILPLSLCCGIVWYFLQLILCGGIVCYCGILALSSIYVSYFPFNMLYITINQICLRNNHAATNIKKCRVLRNNTSGSREIIFLEAGK